jgi:hypothetical protein
VVKGGGGDGWSFTFALLLITSSGWKLCIWKENSGGLGKGGNICQWKKESKKRKGGTAWKEKE